MSSTFKRMVKDMMSYKKYFYAALFSVIVAAVADSLPPRLYSWGIDNFIINKNFENLVPFTIMYVASIIAIGFSIYFFILMAGKLEIAFSRSLREKLFRKVQNLPIQYFNDNQDGWIIARLSTDVSKLSEVLSWQFVDVIYFSLLIIISIMSIFFYSVKAGIIILFTYPILFGLFYYIKVKVLREYRGYRKQNSIIISKFNEFINGVLTIKTMSLETINYKEFKAESNRLQYHARKTLIYASFFGPIISIVGYLIFSLVIYSGVETFIVGDLTIGGMSAIITYMIILLNITHQFTNLISQLQNATASAERIYQLLDEVENPNIDGSSIFTDIFIEEKKDKSGQIELENINFKYQTGEQIFNDFNLQINAGQSIALVGKTGSGKTTLVNLINRFYEPDSGTISIDGVDIKTKPRNWVHHQVGYVLQHPFLFKGTIIENIIYNSKKNKEDVYKICDKLQITEMINRFENKFETQVGDGGSNLSVGEKQLISFARALLTDPRIIILDEATSSIDFESERLIQQAIDIMMEKHTMIIIAHRLSTIRKCDQIICLQQGEIVERGNHHELMAKSGYYYQLNQTNND